MSGPRASVSQASRRWDILDVEKCVDAILDAFAQRTFRVVNFQALDRGEQLRILRAFKSSCALRVQEGR